MGKKIDIARVRRALARLDELAKEHPELFEESPSEDWRDALKGIFEGEEEKKSTPYQAIYTIQEAADFLKVHAETLRRAIRSGKLQAAAIGKRDYRISAVELEHWWRAIGGGSLFKRWPVITNRKPESEE